MELVCANGKRYSGRKFTFGFCEFCLPFAETVNCMTGLPMQMENKLGVGLTWTLYSCSAKLINQIDSN